MWLLIKNLAFTVLVPGTVAVFVPLVVLQHPAEEPTTAPLALLLLFVGVAIYAWCLWDFAITGRGTPAPIDPPKTLVVRGLYKYSRNPMYVGVLCVIFGWAALYHSTTIAAVRRVRVDRLLSLRAVVRRAAPAPGFRRRLYALLFRRWTLADDSKATGGKVTCRP